MTGSVVLLHLVGFAVTFGAWVTEVAAARFRFAAVMNYVVDHRRRCRRRRLSSYGSQMTTGITRSVQDW